MTTSFRNQWERADWIYSQIGDMEKVMQEPEMAALRAIGPLAVYQNAMARRFKRFWNQYPKMFLNCINGKLNKPLLLMCLKQKHRIDTGEVSFQQGQKEVMHDEMSLLLRKMKPELRDSVMKKYEELAKEQDELIKKDIEEALNLADDADGEAPSVMERIEEVDEEQEEDETLRPTVFERVAVAKDETTTASTMSEVD